MRLPRPARTAIILAALVVSASALSGCGRRGNLETPAASAEDKQREADAVAAGAPAQKPRGVPGGGTIVPSTKPFILDPIL